MPGLAEYAIGADVTALRAPLDGAIEVMSGKEFEMLIYPEGMLLISEQRRKELMDEAQRWRLLRAARRSRRGSSSDAVQARDGTADRGRIAGWVAAGGRGRVRIPSQSAGNLAACGPRAEGPAR